MRPLLPVVWMLLLTINLGIYAMNHNALNLVASCCWAVCLGIYIGVRGGR